MSDDLIDQINKLLELGKGDVGRLEHIKSTIQQDKTLYNSDKKYLENLACEFLKEDMQNLDKDNQKNTQQNKVEISKKRMLFL